MIKSHALHARVFWALSLWSCVRAPPYICRSQYPKGQKGLFGYLLCHHPSLNSNLCLWICDDAFCHLNTLSLQFTKYPPIGFHFALIRFSMIWTKFGKMSGPLLTPFLFFCIRLYCPNFIWPPLHGSKLLIMAIVTLCQFHILSFNDILSSYHFIWFQYRLFL